MEWSQVAVNELVSMLSLDINARFNHNHDVWEWSLCNSKIFSIRSVRCLLTSGKKDSNRLIFPWTKVLPMKINVFGWRLLMNRLPSKDSLMRRGLNINNPDCILCGEQAESLDHLMTGCVISKELWKEIEDWCNIPPMILFSAKDLIFYHIYIKGSNSRKEIIQSIILVACWVIWKSRNDMVFNGLKTNASKMLKEVKSLGFLWIKNRLTRGCLEEKQWIEFKIN